MLEDYNKRVDARIDSAYEAGRAAGIRELLAALIQTSQRYEDAEEFRRAILWDVIEDYRARYPVTEPAAKGDGDNGGE